MDNFKLNEKLYFEHLENGLDVIIIPKKGYTKKYAMYATHFGSANYKFKVPGEEKITTVPDGVAHFLEHKLFEEEDGINALDKLSKIGSNANAYTSFNHTAYLFECTEKFEESLDVLMNFVQSPYFTPENVEKEKGIIGQEIRMYDDDPEWQIFFNFLNLIYRGHSITKDIAGTVESISKITPDVLYKCYNTFYDPSNMMICVVGDVDIVKVLNQIKSNVKNTSEKPNIDRFYDFEALDEKITRVEKKMDVSIPIFLFGFKDLEAKLINSGYNEDTNYLVKKHVAIEILFEIIFGKSTELFESLYNEGLFQKELGSDYTFEEDYAYSTISGESKEPDKVIDKVLNRIEEIKINGIDDKSFERAKKMLYGEYVRVFNDVSKIASVFTSDYFKGVNSFDYVDAYKNITKDFAFEILDKHFVRDNMAVSIIKPLGE